MKTAAARKLASFRIKRGLTLTAIARAIGVSVPTVHDWLKGAKRPRTSFRLALERWSGGEVPAADWETASERREIDRVSPLDAESLSARTGTEG